MCIVEKCRPTSLGGKLLDALKKAAGAIWWGGDRMFWAAGCARVKEMGRAIGVCVGYSCGQTSSGFSFDIGYQGPKMGNLVRRFSRPVLFGFEG